MSTPTLSLQRALGHHQQGDLEQAERIYRDVLQYEPRNADAHHLLALILLDRKQTEAAIAHLRMAVTHNPSAAQSYLLLGQALRAAGELAEADTAYRGALGIDPLLAEAHNSLGNLLQDGKRFLEALVCFEAAARLRPDLAEVHFNRGNCHKAAGNMTEAKAAYRHALAVNSDFALAHQQLGLVFQAEKDFAQAEICHREVLKRNPDDVPALTALGAARQLQGDLVDSRACYERALSINSHDAAAGYGLASVLHAQGDEDGAQLAYRSVLVMNPAHLDALAGLGTLHMLRGEFAAAEEIHAHMVRIDPDDASAHFLRTSLLLASGDLLEGWRRLDEYLRHRENAPRRFARPHWDGDDLGRRTLVLHSNFGLGDTLQFVRYVPLVQQRNPGARVVLDVQSSLISLLRQSGFTNLVAEGEPLGDFDVQLPLMALPRAFQTTLATVPADVPYLSADPARIERWATRLADMCGFKIGISWQGSRKYQGDLHRSFALSCLEPLAKIPGATLISLQKVAGSEQVAGVADRFMVCVLDGLDDEGGAFLDTAAVMKNLDLVVTSDSAVAHLAGALGVPVWLALSQGAEWRWLRDRDDSPWYPGMRLFRQTRLDDWSELFDRMAGQLARRIESAKRQPLVS